jgi:hypothetical protein
VCVGKGAIASLRWLTRGQDVEEKDPISFISGTVTT